jgi:transcriptional regulator with XRE-family HTH domain
MPPITDTASKLVALRIKRLRTDSWNWTLAELAEKITEAGGWSPSVSQLSLIERGQRPVSLPELSAIAEAFSSSVEYFTATGSVCEACGQELSK